MRPVVLVPASRFAPRRGECARRTRQPLPICVRGRVIVHLECTIPLAGLAREGGRGAAPSRWPPALGQGAAGRRPPLTFAVHHCAGRAPRPATCWRPWRRWSAKAAEREAEAAITAASPLTEATLPRAEGRTLNKTQF